jgi:hypothetical protein
MSRHVVYKQFAQVYGTTLPLAEGVLSDDECNWHAGHLIMHG